MIRIYTFHQDDQREPMKAMLTQARESIQTAIDKSGDPSAFVWEEVITKRREEFLARRTEVIMDCPMGDYVVFIDSDDWIEPLALRSILEAKAAHPNKGVYCTDQVLHYEDGTTKYVPKRKAYRDALYSAQVFHHLCVFRPINILSDLHPMWMEAIKQQPDCTRLDWTAKLSAAINGGAVHVAHAAYHWRQRSDSLCHRKEAALEFNQTLRYLITKFQHNHPMRKDEIPVFVPTSGRPLPSVT